MTNAIREIYLSGRDFRGNNHVTNNCGPFLQPMDVSDIEIGERVFDEGSEFRSIKKVPVSCRSRGEAIRYSARLLSSVRDAFRLTRRSSANRWQVVDRDFVEGPYE